MGDLLDKIWVASGYCYMSDLKVHGLNAPAKELLVAIDSDHYALEDWQEAIGYISGHYCLVADAEEAKNQLLYLERN